jgi:hypothetical protein
MLLGWPGSDFRLEVGAVRLHNPNCDTANSGGVALAQSESNALVLNQGDEFKNGVIVEGKNGLRVGDLKAAPYQFTTADGKQRTGLRILDLEGSPFGARTHNVILTESAIYIETTWINMGTLQHVYLDLGEAIGKLQSRVAALEAKVK